MLVAARNILKAWLLVLALVGIFGLVGWLFDGVRGLSIFVFCALLVAAGAYWGRVAFDGGDGITTAQMHLAKDG